MIEDTSELKAVNNEEIKKAFGKNCVFVTTSTMQARGFYIGNNEEDLKHIPEVYDKIFVTGVYKSIIKYFLQKLDKTKLSVRLGFVDNKLQIAISYFNSSQEKGKSFQKIDKRLILGELHDGLEKFINAIDTKFNETVLFQIGSVDKIVELFFYTNTKEGLNTIIKVNEKIEDFVDMENDLSLPKKEQIMMLCKQFCMSSYEASPKKGIISFILNFRKK